MGTFIAYVLFEIFLVGDKLLFLDFLHRYRPMIIKFVDVKNFLQEHLITIFRTDIDSIPCQKTHYICLDLLLFRAK